VLKLLSEFVLLPPRVKTREGVLPAPDNDCPSQRENTGGGEDDSRDPSESAHPS
jgi:hypothetical protein